MHTYNVTQQEHITFSMNNCPSTSHSQSNSVQLSLLPSVEREMSTGQSAVMLCGWEVKAGWLIPFLDKRVGGR